MLSGTSAEERTDFIEALGAAVRVLEKTAHERRSTPKEEVPPIGTAAYIAYCQAIYKGEYRAAKAHAERKLRVLSN